MQAKPLRIRDPVHSLIEFRPSDELEGALWRILSTRAFQRLRRVKQLGFSDFVYPGATHSRFSHSVGVFHTARKLLEIVDRYLGKRDQSRERLALAACLLHDVGHGPFSHAFEDVGRRLGLKLADHEIVTEELIRHSDVSLILNEMGSGFASDVADIIKKEGRRSVHNAVVSSQFDADRLYYMRRDRLMTGTRLAEIDFDWLVANLEIADVPTGVDETQSGSVKTFVIGPKAVHAAEGYVLGLFQLYPTVYFHKTTRGVEKLFSELLVRVFTMARDGRAESTGLASNHPLILFANSPDKIDLALTLDDTVVWGALSQISDSSNKAISELAFRIRDRLLFKCVDIKSLVAHEIDPTNEQTAELRAAIDRCCGLIEALILSNPNQTVDGIPTLLLDRVSRSPYRKSGGSRGPEDFINVKTDGGEIVDLAKRSTVVGGLRDYSAFRAYVPPERHQDFVREVSELTKKEAKKCK